MFSFNAMIKQMFQPAPARVDPLGGVVPNMDTSTPVSNMHVPYRGGDFYAPRIEANGQSLSTFNTMPDSGMRLADASLMVALQNAQAYKTQPGGTTNDQFYVGPGVGVRG